MLGFIGGFIQILGSLVVAAGALNLLVLFASFVSEYNVALRSERGGVIVALMTLLGSPFALFLGGLVVMGFGGICRSIARTERTIGNIALQQEVAAFKQKADTTSEFVA